MLFLVSRVLSPHVMQPSIVAAVRQVLQIALVVVGLALKRDAPVGPAPHGEPHCPFDEIDDVEKNETQFTHLRCVDALVVEQFARQVHALMDKQHPEQIDGIKATPGQISAAHNLHPGCKIKQFLYHLQQRREGHSALIRKRR